MLSVRGLMDYAYAYQKFHRDTFETVTSKQKKLMSDIKNLDEFASHVVQSSSVNLAKLEKISQRYAHEVHQIQQQVDRSRMLVYDIFEALGRLNSLLPPSSSDLIIGKDTTDEFPVISRCYRKTIGRMNRPINFGKSQVNILPKNNKRVSVTLSLESVLSEKHKEELVSPVLDTPPHVDVDTVGSVDAISASTSKRSQIFKEKKGIGPAETQPMSLPWMMFSFSSSLTNLSREYVGSYQRQASLDEHPYYSTSDTKQQDLDDLMMMAHTPRPIARDTPPPEAGMASTAASNGRMKHARSNLLGSMARVADSVLPSIRPSKSGAFEAPQNDAERLQRKIQQEKEKRIEEESRKQQRERDRAISMKSSVSGYSELDSKVMELILHDE